MAFDLTLLSTPNHISVITSRAGDVEGNLTPLVCELNGAHFPDFVTPRQREFFQSLLKTTQVVQHDIELFLLCPPPTPYLFSVTPDLRTQRLLLVGYRIPAGAQGKASFNLAGMHELKGNFFQFMSLDRESPDAELKEQLRQQMLARANTLSPFEPDKSPVGEMVPFNLSRIIESFNTIYSRRCALEEKIYVPAEIPDSLGFTTLFGDSSSLGKILDNLLSNAVKYTGRPRGEVRFSFSVETVSSLDGAASVDITFRITDSGQGIREEDRGRLFRFGDRLSYGEGGAASPQIEGQGVGLADSKTTADLLGWTLGFKENEESPGTTFFLTAAFKKNDPLPELSEEPALLHKQRNIQVLVIEDSPVILMVIRKLLERAGIQTPIITPHNMGEALAACRSDSLDLIITDRQLWARADRGGDQVVQERRSWENSHSIRRVPCILSSADTVTPEELREMDGTGILPKPHRLVEIEKLLNRFFPIDERGTTLQPVGPPLQLPPPPERGGSL